MSQIIINGIDSCLKLNSILTQKNIKKFMLVCGKSFSFLSIKNHFDDIQIPYVRFDSFKPNPLYEDVCNGVKMFNDEKCDCIVAVGGGSAIDVAKCIKLYCKMNSNINYLQQDCKDSGVMLVAIPTTAGTGSESTKFAVIYFNGEKQSAAHESIMPNYAILESKVLKTLPIYQKKCSVLDALCQGIESWWCVNSTNESKAYSQTAVEKIIANMEAYIQHNEETAAENIMLAANFAGRAINITQTTAPHAMSYKLTSMYSLPHGHAAAICLPHVWKYMIDNIDKCMDLRGSDYLQNIFIKIASALGVDSVEKAIIKFEDILNKFQINNPTAKSTSDVEYLTESVNLTRLKNNPIQLSKDTITKIYTDIVVGGKNET